MRIYHYILYNSKLILEFKVNYKIKSIDFVNNYINIILHLD